MKYSKNIPILLNYILFVNFVTDHVSFKRHIQTLPLLLLLSQLVTGWTNLTTSYHYPTTLYILLIGLCPKNTPFPVSETRIFRHLNDYILRNQITGSSNETFVTLNRWTRISISLPWPSMKSNPPVPSGGLFFCKFPSGPLFLPRSASFIVHVFTTPSLLEWYKHHVFCMYTDHIIYSSSKLLYINQTFNHLLYFILVFYVPEYPVLFLIWPVHRIPFRESERLVVKGNRIITHIMRHIESPINTISL